MNLSAIYSDLTRARESGDHKRVLEVAIRLVELAPDDPSVRMAIAETLVRLGDNDGAASVYQAMAWHCAKAGYPLAAISAARLLGELKPGEDQDALEVVVALYGKDSDRVGPPGLPFRPPGAVSRDADLDPVPDSGMSIKELQARAAEVAAETEGTSEFPEQLPAIPIFSRLSEDAFLKLLGSMTVVRAQTDDKLIKQGDEGDSLYLVADGRLRVVRMMDGGKAVPLASLNEGAVVGEMAVITAEPRTATVVALRDAVLLKLRRDDLIALADEVQPVAEALEGFRRERLVYNLMATSPLFGPFDRDERFALLSQFGTFEVPNGTILLEQGGPAQGLYLVLHGECVVTHEEQEVARLKEGDVFGEISLLRDLPATAEVKTARDSVILFLAREVFSEVAEKHPEVKQVLDQLAEERVRAAAEAQESSTEDDHAVLV